MNETLPITGPFGARARRGAVRVHEVGPRDGLQAEPHPIDSETKTAFCRDLLAAGVRSLEVTSFVHPRLVPQMADADVVARAVGELAASLAPEARLLSLAPNRRGLGRALEAGVHSIGVIASATESFARANLGMDLESSLQMSCETARDAVDAGLEARGYLSMCFGDPWEGAVSRDAVLRASERLLEAGCSTIVISDTIGVGHAGQVEDLLADHLGAGIAEKQIAMHFHDTYGQALSNVTAALACGIREFDASASGLGRCPFAPGATGNLATEDLLWALEGMGWDTGIDLAALATASDPVDEALGRETASSVKKAMSRRVPAVA